MKIFNTLTRQKDEFKPIEPGKVRMYVCGPTVYNYFHVGNARPFTIFDTVRRYLEYRGYDVTYVQNFTDVDDKIIRKANEEGVEAKEISERYIAEYFKDADALGINRADVHPKVTDVIPEIIEFISTLIEKGHAYEVNGDVYFDTTEYEGYGKLSKQSIDELESGARVEVNDIKKNPTDFALWKKQKKGEPGWESPWGLGRPGWHIECSVMSTKYLGKSIDIHAGGQDLIFPHHENEIAQSEAYSGESYVNYWIHNGYINIDNQKMSKSKGNFFTVRDILKEYDPEVIRFFILMAHYRSPINFSRELIESAQNALNRLYNGKEHLEYLMSIESADTNEDDATIIEKIKSYKTKFIEAMDDDFNTADAIAAIFELVKEININIKPESSKQVKQTAYDVFVELTQVFGIISKEKEMLDDEINKLIEERQNARKNKDFALSDKIRDDLKAQGIILEDTPQGVKWKRN